MFRGRHQEALPKLSFLILHQEVNTIVVYSRISLNRPSFCQVSLPLHQHKSEGGHSDNFENSTDQNQFSAAALNRLRKDVQVLCNEVPKDVFSIFIP